MGGIVKVAKKIENTVSRIILPGPAGKLDRKVRAKVQDWVMGKPKDPMVNDAGKLDDLSIQSSAYGAPISLILGPWRAAGEIIWATPKKATPHVETQVVGGKGGLFGGGSQEIQTTTYTYSASFAVGLADCRDQAIAGIAKIWANGKLIYNIGDGATYQSYIASLSQASAVRVYTGTSTQTPDPLIVATEGVAPAWRGLAYVVFENLQLGEWNNSVPNLEFEMIPAGTYSIAVSMLDSPGQLYWGDGSHFAYARMSVMNDGNLAVAVVDATTSVGQMTVRNPYDLTVVRSLGQVTNGFPSFHVNQYGAVFTGSRYISPSGAASSVLNDLQIGGAMDLEGNFYAAGRLSSSPTDTKAVVQVKTDGTQRVLLSWTLVDGFHKYPSALYLGHNGYLYVSIEGPGTDYLWKIDIASGQVVKSSTVSVQLRGMTVCADDTVYGFDDLGASLYRMASAWTSSPVLVHTGSVASHTTRRQLWRDWQHGGVISDFQGGLIRWAPDGTSVVLNPSAVELYGKANHPGYPGRLYSYQAAPLLYNNNNSVAAVKESLAGGSIGVATAISRLCAEAGLSAGEIDVASVGDTFGGGARVSQTSVRQALEPLMSAFLLQLVDTGTKLKFVKYGAAPVLTLTSDDLIMAASAEDYTAVVTDDMQESELPSEVLVQYRDSSRNYLADSQYGRRLVTTSRHKDTLQYQLVMTPTQASQLAHAKLYDRWVARKTRRFATWRKHARLECGDVITIPFGTGTINVLLRAIKDDGVRRVIEAEDNESAVYSQTVAGNAGAAQSTTVGAVSPMLSQLLDVPLVRDSDDDHGIYVAAGGVLAGWTGGRLYKSADSGLTFADTNLTFTTASVTGSTLGVLGNYTGGNMFDELSTVDVVVSNGTLASITEAQALSDLDMMLIGHEYVTPKNRVLTGANTYRLTGFLRGRKGTEWAMGLHVSGERVVVMSASAARNLAMAASEIGQARVFKGVSFGGLLATATQQSTTYRAERLKPRAPAYLWGGRDAAGNITGSLIRSARKATNWANLINVPLDEAAEAYEIDVFAGTALGVTGITNAVNAELTVTGALPGVGEQVYAHSVGGMIQANERAFTVVAITAANKFTVDADSSNWAPYTSGGSILKRKPSGTIAVSAPAFSYSSAQQVADYGSNQAPVRVAGYQISARVGRGVAKTAII